MTSLNLTSAVAGLALILAAPQAGAGQAADVAAAVDQVMAAKGLGSPDAPGCAVSVTKGDDLLFAKAYGSADLEHGAPFGLQTVSETGSVAKQFTAAEVLLLAEDGRLSLQDDVRKYLPEMPDYGEPITIYDLLHQISGVREYSTLAALRGYPRFYKTLYDLDSAFALIAAQDKLNFRPGARYEYSNSNYVLLTLVVERVSGMRAAEFGRRRLFEPLGMTSTQWRDDYRRVVKGRALAYRLTRSGYELFMPLENTFGHGALLTTVGDLERWNRALVSGSLSPYVTRHMLEPGRLDSGETRSYGAGIVVGDYRGHRVYRHGGTTAGYTAQLWAFPDDRVSIALLCNVRAGEMADISAQAADAALGLSATPAPPPDAAPPQAAGRPAYYRSGGGEMLALTTSGAATSVDLFTSNGPMRLTATAGWNRLAAVTPFGRLDLHRDGANPVVVSFQDREPLVFAAMPAAAPSAPPPLGLYVNASLGAYVLTKTTGYRLALADLKAADPVGFRLEWLNGDVYRARIETRSGYLRDDMIVTFQFAPGKPASLQMSSVAGLQAVDRLEFTRVDD
jgi:CubicO group peptidase (beta-lactamase class C family)